MYIGCLILPLLVVLILVLSIIGRTANFIGTFVLYYWNKVGYFLTDCWDWVTKPFRPKPLESEFDSNYYTPTEEAPKRYDDEDGEKTDFTKVKS